MSINMLHLRHRRTWTVFKIFRQGIRYSLPEWETEILKKREIFRKCKSLLTMYVNVHIMYLDVHKTKI